MRRHGEAVLFWAIVAAHLVPIWAFKYLPTQDGPAHLSGALILKDYGAPGTRYHEFFEVRSEIIPNWTAHVLLAGLMFLAPPLVAEKLLVSIYIVGWAAALRYFCGAFGPRARPLALVGLLFVFNRCFWLGFHNVLLSFALCWFLLGYWLRRRDEADIFTAAALTLVLVLTFFTHLVGFLIAAVSLGWLALTSPRHRWRNLGWVALACLPATFFALDYFDRSGFFGAGGSQRLRDSVWEWLRGQGSWHLVGDLVMAADDELFAHHAGDVPLAFLAFALYGVLLVMTILGWALDLPVIAAADSADQVVPEEGVWLAEPDAAEPGPPARWPVLVLALAFTVVYLLFPEHLSMEHGGFLRTRLALVPPLLFLACLREPNLPGGPLIVRTLTVATLAVNLALVTQRIATDNRAVAEYTAAMDAVGSGHVLFVAQDLTSAGPQRVANPLLHASQHYALGTTNVNLDNYQATTRHFPLRFRDGITRARGAFAWYERPQDVDVILAWEMRGNRGIPATYRSVFRQGKLEVFVRAIP